MKPFDLEAFKAGQKALTRDGRVAKLIAICDECGESDKLVVKLDNLHHVSCYPLDGMCYNQRMQLVSMVSRHQALIDSYNPEDTWQINIGGVWWVVSEPEWFEERDYRLHPHNDLIKAYRKGAKIKRLESGGYLVDDPNPTWDEHNVYRIKPELEFTYPIYKQSKHSGVVVEFTDLTTGKVLVGNNFYESDQVQITGIPHTDATQWQDWTPLTKSKLTTHCLAYDAKRFDHEQTTEVQARVVKKEVAEANDWKIIQEWEV